jgi:hypothetical protein
VQLQNAWAPIDEIELGMWSEVRPVQSLKAWAPMEVIERGKCTIVSCAQPLKALSPILVTLAVGEVTDARLEHDSNAKLSIVTQDLDSVTETSLWQLENVPD